MSKGLGGKVSLEGKTPEGLGVVSGVYTIYETIGFPLEDLLHEMYIRGFLPCWKTLLSDMVSAGMKRDKAVKRIISAVSEAYPPEFRDCVLERLASVV